ncbi:glycosyltransferase family 2 protein [Pelagibacteraceae bacterium]|nr:glycosyltransferase family 2 protein [Pelagibacteraceae bacterium]
MFKKISIYIPAHNGERTIGAALESIAKQTKKIDEIIVVNDFSTDNTLKILNSFQNIKIINNSKNEGLPKTRNIAINSCTNEIIANIDQDIVLDKFWLENILKFLSMDNVVMCGGNTQDKILTNIYNKWRSDRYPLNWGLENIKNPAFLFGSNSIQYKSLWQELNGYSEEFRSAGDDVSYSRKISQKDKITFYVSSALCYHLQNDNLFSLADRVWRYHSFGYKNTRPSFYRFLKLSIKQTKIFSIRFFKNILKLNLLYVCIDFFIFISFLYFEIKNTVSKKI